MLTFSRAGQTDLFLNASRHQTPLRRSAHVPWPPDPAVRAPSRRRAESSASRAAAVRRASVASSAVALEVAAPLPARDERRRRSMVAALPLPSSRAAEKAPTPACAFCGAAATLLGSARRPFVRTETCALHGPQIACLPCLVGRLVERCQLLHFAPPCSGDALRLTALPALCAQCAPLHASPDGSLHGACACAQCRPRHALEPRLATWTPLDLFSLQANRVYKHRRAALQSFACACGAPVGPAAAAELPRLLATHLREACARVPVVCGDCAQSSRDVSAAVCTREVYAQHAAVHRVTQLATRWDAHLRSGGASAYECTLFASAARRLLQEVDGGGGGSGGQSPGVSPT